MVSYLYLCVCPHRECPELSEIFQDIGQVLRDHVFYQLKLLQTTTREARGQGRHPLYISRGQGRHRDQGRHYCMYCKRSRLQHRGQGKQHYTCSVTLLALHSSHTTKLHQMTQVLVHVATVRFVENKDIFI